MKRHSKILLVFFIFVFISCGEEDKKTSSTSTSQDVHNVDSGAKEIQGILRLNGTGAQGYVVRCYSLVSNKYRDAYTDKDGIFTIPLAATDADKFEQGEAYSFHVLDLKKRRIGIVDFSSQAGLQGSIIFDGGIGFDLGYLDITENSFGVITAIDFEVSLSGGFYLDSTRDGDLSSSDLPSFISSLLFGRELTVGNPSDLYYMFVKRSDNAELFTKGLSKYGGIFVEMEADPLLAIDSAWAGGVFDWYEYSLIRENPFDDPTSGTLWDKLSYNFISAGSKTESSITSRSRFIEGAYFPISVKSSDGTISQFSRFLGSEVVRPPIISRFDRGLGATTLSAAAEDEGLLNLVALDAANGNVLLEIIRPAYSEIYGASENTVTDFDTISIRLEYYSGNTEIDTSQNDFDVVFNTSRTSVAATKTGTTYSWDFDRKELTRLVVIDNAAGSCVDTTPEDCLDLVEIPRSLFLENNGSIDRVKVSILYKGTTVRSGGSYWFESN